MALITPQRCYDSASDSFTSTGLKIRAPASGRLSCDLYTSKYCGMLGEYERLYEGRNLDRNILAVGLVKSTGYISHLDF